MSSKDQRSTLQKVGDRIAGIASSLAWSWDNAIAFPPFDELPKIPGHNVGCLWGFFDKDGQRDEVGTINLLTPDVVKQASREIQTGEHVQLDWPLENVQFPGFGRKEFDHTVIDLKPAGMAALDDEIHINTQSGSQWDSLKHFAHQKSGMYYNGLTHEEAIKTTRNGTHNWCLRGGIVGRGVLIDWVREYFFAADSLHDVRWYEHKHGTPPSPITRHEISVSDLEETLEYQRTSPRKGDVLFVRSGYVRWHNKATPEERKKGTKMNNKAIGLRNDEETVRWLYERHLSAVVGDTLAFEAWPPPIKSGWCLHEWLLTAWGTPIGELWNLEGLSEKCEAENRWTFFVTSAPLHVVGGVGSPPGAIAIF